MTEAAHQQPILHHYPISPFAEKVRAMLGYKGLPWKSVQIPLFMPKPDVVALTGGFRKTPILQIGADVYCDTALIARALERLKPSPTLFPQGDSIAQRAMEHFADSVMFNIVIPIAFQPTGMAKVYYPDATPEFLAAFGKDRAAMRQGGTIRRGPLPECKANTQALLTKVEAQLKGNYLFGEQASAADFSLYHVLWPLRQVPELKPMLAPFPRTLAFIERIVAMGHGKFTEIPSAEALRIASASKADAVKSPAAYETAGIELGRQASVMAVDSGFEPTTGELVQASADEIILRRTDPRAGTVHVHFPRFGYQISAPA